MSILIFVVVLIVLIFVHELGHFSISKAFGVRVDEFGLGFPPKIIGRKYGETEYSLNWIPFGGFVKIFGENPDEDSISGPDSSRSLVNKPKWVQALVMVAGVSFNIIFAWILISFGFMNGMPASVESYPNYKFNDAKVVITSVMPGSPADKAGLKAGDSFVSMSSQIGKATTTSASDIQNFITENENKVMTIVVNEGQKEKTATATPISGLLDNKVALGIGLDTVGTLKLPIHEAFYQGAILTSDLTKATVIGLGSFFKNIFIAKADLSQVTGPVGIIGLVGDAANLGFIYLLSFTAFISINLAVINLLPFPALDGGRIVFIFIEAIKRSPIKPKIANALNAIGFALLIILMIVITFHDILKSFF